MCVYQGRHWTWYQELFSPVYDDVHTKLSIFLIPNDCGNSPTAFFFFFGHHFKMTFVIDGELIYYYYYYSNIYKVNEMWHCTIMCYATENDDSMFCVFKNLICIHSTKSAHRSRKLAFAHARVQSYTYPRLVS